MLLSEGFTSRDLTFLAVSSPALHLTVGPVKA